MAFIHRGQTFGDTLLPAIHRARNFVVGIDRKPTAAESVFWFLQSIEELTELPRPVVVQMMGVGVVIRNEAGERVNTEGSCDLWWLSDTPDVFYANSQCVHPIEVSPVGCRTLPRYVEPCIPEVRRP
jgi:hypothetical protein